MNTPKRVAAFVAAAALTTVALTGCVIKVPTAGSSAPVPTQQQQVEPQVEPAALTDEDRYMEAAMKGITHESVPSNVEDMIVEMGYLTCQAWDEGATRSMLIAVVDSGIGDSSGFTPDAAKIFVDAALTHLC